MDGVLSVSDPIDANDSSGFQAIMSYDPSAPNRRWLDFYNVSFTGKGDSPEARKNWIDETQDRLTGTFGAKDVVSTVHPAPGNKPVPGGIVINIETGKSVIDSSGKEQNAFTEWDVYGSGGKTVTIPAKPPSWTTIPHEDFHLACFSCSWPGGHNLPGNTIMNSVPPSSRSITQELFDIVERAQSSLPSVNSPPPWLKGSGSFLDGVGGGGNYSGADGGFLLYPNKPNNNNISAVYSK